MKKDPLFSEENVELVANEFLKILTRWFAHDGKKLSADRVKNANDYYDANMAMLEAAEKCDATANIEDEKFYYFMNRAWSRAIEIQTKK